MWADLSDVGRSPVTGGYRRFAFTPEDGQLREWFEQEADVRGLDLTVDRAGNLWAWWGDPDLAGPGVVTGSHLDSVPAGGAFDGPLGVASAFAAIDLLHVQGFIPGRPIGVVCFGDEEGARFGVACTGSRLLTGALAPDRARGLTDTDGMSYADAMAWAGRTPHLLGPDPEMMARIGRFVELHVEQGRGLIDLGAPVGVASEIWPHGRYRFTFTGRADHAGTTRMSDRADPMLTYAMTALAANKQARSHNARATFGRISVQPNGTNAVPSLVTAWLDARAENPVNLDTLLTEVRRQAIERAKRDGTKLEVAVESWSDLVTFDVALRDRLSGVLAGAPVLATAAGHDAGVLSAAGIPTAMLFVRNPTGISHSPDEFAELGDCAAGVRALADVLRALAG
ncbi:MAG: allantoate amidohydrolase [Actinomycetota bacterium]|nr:allantoate amidohydrolase [Actinomycetota bacterium]